MSLFHCLLHEWENHETTRGCQTLIGQRWRRRPLTRWRNFPSIPSVLCVFNNSQALVREISILTNGDSFSISISLPPNFMSTSYCIFFIILSIFTISVPFRQRTQLRIIITCILLQHTVGLLSNGRLHAITPISCPPLVY